MKILLYLDQEGKYQFQQGMMVRDRDTLEMEEDDQVLP
jgi:hypothetical protein